MTPQPRSKDGWFEIVTVCNEGTLFKDANSFQHLK